MNNLNDKNFKFDKAVKFDKPIKTEAYYSTLNKNIFRKPTNKEKRVAIFISSVVLILLIGLTVVAAILSQKDEPTNIEELAIINIEEISIGETIMGGEPANYAYLDVAASDLHSISDEKYKLFIKNALDNYSDCVWLSLVIDQKYTIQYIPEMPDSFYYGISKEEGKVLYGVEVIADDSFSIQNFLDNVETYNAQVAENKGKADEISEQQRQEILSAIDQQLESLIKSADGVILAANYVSDNSYEVYVSNAWYLSTQQAKESYANAVLLWVQTINSKYIGDGYVALHIYDKNRIPVARDDVWSGMKVLN